MARYFLLTILILILSVATAAAETVAGLPLHVQKLNSQVIRVWIGDHVSSTATVAVATKKGLVVIDTLGYPEVDRQLRDIIAREFGRNDFKYLINTHEHGDHTGGNIAYADCTIVGHELVEEGMKRRLERQGEMASWVENRIGQLEEELAALEEDDPGRARLQEDLIVRKLGQSQPVTAELQVFPTKTFSDQMVLDLGDTTFEMFYIGGMHTASDIAILIPRHGLLLTGDTMADVWLNDTPGCLASFVARSGVKHDFPKLLKNWNALLARQDEIETYLPGHWNGELSYEGFAARVKYIEDLWANIGNAVDSGATMDEVLAANRLDARFAHLVDSPGCNAQNNYMTIMEMWTCHSGQGSAADELYALIEKGAGDSEIAKVLAEKNAEKPEYYFVEAQLNAMGYRFLQQEKVPMAEAMFRANVELFPESWNVYDSLAESLLAGDKREEAIAMYQKSLEINPESTSGKEALQRIRAEEI